MREDLAQRLSESFENALNLAEGLVIVAAIDKDFDDWSFLQKLHVLMWVIA